MVTYIQQTVVIAYPADQVDNSWMSKLELNPEIRVKVIDTTVVQVTPEELEYDEEEYDEDE